MSLPQSQDRVDATHNLALQALGAILQSGVIGERSRLRSVLRYLVTEEIEGRGDRLKAYSIGVDVIGRSEDFDPSSDSIVRVEMNRLRAALDAYYAGPGADDPLEISLPPGTYRPAFNIRKEADAETEENAAAPARRRRFWMAAVAAVVCVAAIAGYFLWDRGPSLAELDAARLDAPIVEVGEIQNLVPEPQFGYVADGLRSLLLSDLSHFRTMRVRLQPSSAQISAGDAELADFRVAGFLTRPGDAIRLQLVLIDTETLQILWSVDEALPDTYNGLHDVYIERIHEFAGAIGSPSGAIVAESLRRAEALKIGAEEERRAVYPCLLRWHAFDLTKTPGNRERARACLAAHIENDVQIGAIWAAYAMMWFLDWTLQENRSPTDLEPALVAAKRAIRLDPNGSEGHEYLGSINLALGRTIEARRHFERAAALNPSKPDIRLVLGWGSCMEGKPDEGLAGIRRGIELSPAPPGWFYITLSMCLFQTAEYDAALDAAESVVRTGDDRGVPLALAAAARAGRADAVERYRNRYNEMEGDPMGPIIGAFNVPSLIRKYQDTLVYFVEQRER